ncbi:MAG: gluzincin family metallopeptidase, partial [Candidatus Xenobia bacterium]
MDVSAAKPTGKKPAPPTDKKIILASTIPDDLAASFPVDSFKPQKTVKLSFAPQDAPITDVETIDVPADGLKPGLVGPRLAVSEPRNFPTPKPNADGNYIYAPEDPRFDAAQLYGSAYRAMKMAEKYIGRPIPWGFKNDLERDTLLLHPHAGMDVMNAFYSSESGSLNTFSYKDPLTHEVLRTGSSADIDAHETGHALLDGIRHMYIQDLSVFGAGFHEAFGDMVAFLTALQDDKVIEALYQETNGDLMQPNVVNKIAERMGLAVSHTIMKKVDPDADEKDYLRTMANNFKMADQHFFPYLPNRKDPDSIGQEPHSFCNIFTGAFYELFCRIYSDAASDPKHPFADAVAEARDAVGKLLFRGMEFAPVGSPKYDQIALSMIKADALDNDGKYTPLILKTFINRKILTEQSAQDFIKHEHDLPDLKLDTPVDTRDSAMKFLDANREKLGVGKDIPFEFLESHTTPNGETFIQYKFEKRVPLDDPDFGQLEGSRMKTNGGLLLAFDKDKNLIDCKFDDVTDQD